MFRADFCRLIAAINAKRKLVNKMQKEGLNLTKSHKGQAEYERLRQQFFEEEF